MHICYAVRSSSEAALHDVSVAADDPPVMSFPSNKKEAETRENPWVSASKKLFEFDGSRRLMASSPSAVKDDAAVAVVEENGCVTVPQKSERSTGSDT